MFHTQFAWRLLKFAWVYALWVTGALRRAKHRLQAEGAVVVLTLHRILPDQEYSRTTSQASIVVREATFAALCRYLQRSCELLDFHAPEPDWQRPAQRIRVAITFDDGWEDNFTTAFPLAAQHDIPWTVFVCPGLEGRSFPFWPERVMAHYRPRLGAAGAEQYIERLKGLPPERRDQELASLAQNASLPANEPNNATMTWQKIRLLHQSGVVIGSHTDTHQILTQLDSSAAERELRLSRDALERALQAPCWLFAYPNGNYTPTLRDLVEATGYTHAFTTRPGAWRRGCDPLLVPRINISEQKVTGWRGHFSRATFEYSVFWTAAREAWH